MDDYLKMYVMVGSKLVCGRIHDQKSLMQTDW